MAALGDVTRDANGGHLVTGAAVSNSKVTSTAGLAASSVQYVLGSSASSVISTGLVRKSGYGKVCLTEAGVEWVNSLDAAIGDGTDGSVGERLVMNVACTADKPPPKPPGSSSSDSDDGAIAAARQAKRASMQAARASAAAKSDSMTAARLRGTVVKSTLAAHGAVQMGLNPRACFDHEDEAKWAIRSRHDDGNGAGASDGSCSDGDSEGASSSSGDGGDDGDSENARMSSDDGVEEESLRSDGDGGGDDESLRYDGDDGDATAADTDALLEGTNETDDANECVPLSTIHRFANNTIARMAVYCGYKCGTTGDDGENVAPTKAPVGKLRQLLARMHRKLPRAAMPVDKDAEAERVVFERVRSAVQMLKKKCGHNTEGDRGKHHFNEADRKAYHTILGAALPRKPQRTDPGSSRARRTFRRVCRALGVPGKGRPPTAAQQSYDRRAFIDRADQGVFTTNIRTSRAGNPSPTHPMPLAPLIPVICARAAH